MTPRVGPQCHWPELRSFGFTFLTISVVDTAEVTISVFVGMEDAHSNGNTVGVDQVALAEGGFVTIHDDTLLDGEVLGSVGGTSEYLEPGDDEGVEVEFDDLDEDDGTVIAMAHQDTNDNEQYDFVDSEGPDDGPFVTDDADLVMNDTTLVNRRRPGAGMSGADGTGFGVVAALVAVLGGLFVARRTG